MISYKEHRQHRKIKTLISSNGRLDGYYNPTANYWVIERNDIFNYCSIISDNKDII